MLAGSLQHPYVEGAELVYLRHPDRLCLGLVGTTKLCCPAQGICAITKHRDSRASLPAEAVLLVRATALNSVKPNCFLASSLSTAGMENTLIEEFLAGSGQDWGSAFGLARIGNIKTKAAYEQKADIMATAHKVVDDCRSPAKIEARLATEMLLDSVYKIAGRLKELPSLLRGLSDLTAAEAASTSGKNILEYHVQIEMVLSQIVTQL